MNDDDQLDLFTVDSAAPPRAAKATAAKSKPLDHVEPLVTDTGAPAEPVEKPDEASIAEQAAPDQAELISSEPAPPSDEASVSDASVTAAAEQVEADVQPDAAEDRWFYVTNRLNLVSALSARLIGPRSSFVKYYADLLDDVPGWIPLVSNPPTKGMLDRVTAERGAGNAVIVELPGELSGLCRADDGGEAFVPAVALADVVKIHFPDEKSLRQHRARPFGNVHPHDELLLVSPELFESVVDSAPDFNAPPDPQVDWRSVDRLRGGVSAAVAAANTGEMLAAAARVLGAPGSPADELPLWLSWTNWSSLTGDPNNEPSSELDERVFRVAYSILGTSDAADSWSPRSVLQELREQLGADANDATVASSLTEAEEVIGVERPFEPFPYGQGGLRSMQAVLLVLLRPSLVDLIGWSPQESGADEVTRVLAAVLGGCLRGLSREAVEIRSLALDDFTARWAVSLALDEGKGSIGAIQLTETGEVSELVAGDNTIKSTPPRREPLVSRYLAIDEAQRNLVRVQTARAMRWPVTTTIRVPGECTIDREGEQLVLTTVSVPILSETVDEAKFVELLGSVEPWRHDEALGLLKVS